MGLRRIVVAVVALLVVTGLVLGVVSGIFGSFAHRGLAAAGIETSGAPGTGSVHEGLHDRDRPVAAAVIPPIQRPARQRLHQQAVQLRL